MFNLRVKLHNLFNWHKYTNWDINEEHCFVSSKCDLCDVKTKRAILYMESK